jgi:hypothetical protein
MYNPKLGAYVMATLGLSNLTNDESWPILKVYEAFSKVAAISPEIFGDLYFSIKGGHLYSKELEELLFQMGTARLLEVRNPEYGCYLINAKAKDAIKQYLEGHLLADELKEAEKLANQFRVKIKDLLSEENGQFCAV